MGGKTGLYHVGVPIKENTKKGYKMAYEGDSIDLAYAEQNTRRGRVGHRIAHTLTTESTQGTVHFVDLDSRLRVTEEPDVLLPGRMRSAVDILGSAPERWKKPAQERS